jgi:hypothetical protein
MNSAARLTAICFAASMMLAAPTADAGWVLTESNGDETLISSGKMRSAWENGSIIFDSATEGICFIDERRKIMAEGTVDDLCEGLNKMMESMMADIPEEQREMMKKMMGGAAGETAVTKKGPGEKIAGFDTTRYEVSQGGEPYETLWLTDDESLKKDFQGLMPMLTKFSACMAAVGGMGDASPESSPAYLKLFETGMIVKSVEHGGEGEASSTTVISPQDVPDSAFDIPDGYEEVPLSTIWGG